MANENATGSNQRRSMLRGLVLAVGGVGIAALSLWIALGILGEDQQPQQVEVELRGVETPEAAVDAYLDGLVDGEFAAMAGLFANPSFRIRAEHDWWYTLRDTAVIEVTPGPIEQVEDVASASFVTNVRFITGDEWSYSSTIPLVEEDGRWFVDWAPGVLHPSLARGESVRAKLVWPERGRILAHDGTALTEDRPAVLVGVVPERIGTMDEVTASLQQHLDIDPARVHAAVEAPGVQPDWFLPLTMVRPPDLREVKPELVPVAGIVFRETLFRLSPASGFAAHVLGRVDEVTAEQLDKLGAPYQPGDQVGLSGLERVFEPQLAGSPSVEVVRLSQTGETLEVLHRSSGRDAGDLLTTLDPAVQRAVEQTLDAAPEPSAIVVLEAATGEIRGVGSRPLSEFNRAFGARYPPGSTYKIITATALQLAGFEPGSVVSCPAEIVVGGGTIHNAGGVSLGRTTLLEAFAHSCNTTFAPLGAELGTADLVAAAELFGFGHTYELPLPVAGGQFPAPESSTERGAASIGQGRVLASPLHMATVAAAVATGDWHAPHLLADQDVEGIPLGIDVARLQEMMQAVVDHGTGTAAQGEGETVFGKTGSAEFGEGDPLPTHAWFVGYRGPLAFAVFVEGGGSGGGVAAPLAAKLLDALDQEVVASAAPLAPCASASWPTFQGTNERSGCNLTATIEDFRIVWATKVGIQGWLNNPVISGDTVFTGSAGLRRGEPDSRDGVYALRLSDGSVVWIHAAGNDVNGVAVNDDVVIATGDEGSVWALNSSDGSVRWAFPKDEEEDIAAVFTNPLIVHDLAVVGDAEGVLYALDLATGEPRWTAQLDTSIRGGAASDNEAIYVVGEAGDARAFSLDGREYWRRSLTFENRNSETLTARVFAAPTVVGDLVVIPYVRDTSYSTPALVALDRYIGSIRWEGSDPDAVRDGWGNLRSSPAVAGDLLLFADPTFPGLVAVDTTDGTAQWALEGGTSCLEHWPSPAIAGTTVVLPLHDGGLYAFDLDTRQMTGSLYLGVAAHEGAFPEDFRARTCGAESPIFASPAIASDGTVVIGTAEGYVFKIEGGS